MKPYVYGNSVYVVLDGDLDIDSREEIAEALPPPEQITGGVINLARATYVDSTLLGMLVQFRRNFIKSGGDPSNLILVLAKNGKVRRTFELTGMNRLFSVAYVESTPIAPQEYMTQGREYRIT